MNDLNLLYTDIEDDVRAAVRDLLNDACDPTAVTALYDGDRSIVDRLWKTIAVDLGLAGLLVPEERGGAGGSAREVAVVLEELGRAAAPVPFLTSSVLATGVLLAADHPVLAEVAGGARTAALTVPLSLPVDGALPAIAVDAEGRLTGSVRSVAGVLEADILLVPALGEAGVGVYLVPTDEASVAPVSSLDMTRQLADLTFDAVAGELLIADGEPAVRRALAVTAALLPSEQYGVARWCLDETVAYLKERRQFGRVVGGFQAIKHRLADLYTAVESANAIARNAAASLAEDDEDLPLVTAVAQAFCSDVAVRAAEEAIQLHGGIGMTWEHPAHLRLKRAKADQIAMGTAGHHRERLAELVDLPGIER